MAIDLERINSSRDLRFTRLEGWDVEGHEVAWLQFEGTRTDGSIFSGKGLYCECDFGADNALLTICEHKKIVFKHFREESQDLYHAQWVSMGPKEAVLDIFRRVRAGERLFEHHHGVIYIQEVAELLALPERVVWALCDELFVEEKLNLNGAILIPYVQRFRFPKELQNLMAYMIEEPLGWPNGEAGDCFLDKIEGAIDQHTRYKHGKDAFWSENYPYIAPHHLAVFGFNWLAMALYRATKDSKARKDLNQNLDLELFVEEMKKLAERYRRFSRKAARENETST